MKDTEVSSWVRTVRLLLNFEGQLRHLASFSTGSDGGIYVFPQSLSGQYYCGQESLGEKVVSHTFRFDSEVPVEVVPKLSMHPSGQVHLKSGSEYLAGPLQMPRFAELRGEHVATVGATRFGALPAFPGRPRTSGSRVDAVVPVRAGVHAGRFAVYFNGVERAFAARVPIFWPLQNGAWVGVSGWTDEDLGDDATFAIAGWDPTRGPGHLQSLLFVYGA